MFPHLQIYDPRERLIVGLADLGLSAGAAAARVLPRRAAHGAPARILLLRLERIGDLLMSAPAIEAVRRHAPGARIDLVVGSWNLEVARRLRGVDAVEALDAPWLARGAQAPGAAALARQAWGWRTRRYDLAINFEGDIRSHGLMALSGAPARVGFAMAGGGPLLTTVVPHDPSEHTTANAARLVGAAFGLETAGPLPPFRLSLPDEARAAAGRLVPDGGRLVAMHVSGGRAIKQWDLDRFAAAGARVAQTLGATLVLTGGPDDAPLVGRVRQLLPDSLPVRDLTGAADLLILAAILERSALVITGDTGPMHLAAAVGAKVVAVFGPSQPVRYAPIGTRHRIVRIDLPCAPCNRIRKPPERCQGHTPDCLAGVTVESVVGAALDLAREGGA